MKTKWEIWAVNQMLLFMIDRRTNIFFYDCSTENSKGRRSLCYTRAALESRKEHKPKNSAILMAADIGIKILTEQK